MEQKKVADPQALAAVTWRSSSITPPDAENVVEVAFLGEDDGWLTAVRDGQNPDGPVLLFTPAEWDAFVGGAKDGEFDLE